MRSLEATAEYIARRQYEMSMNGYLYPMVEVSAVLYAYDVTSVELAALVKKSYERIVQEQQNVKEA